MDVTQIYQDAAGEWRWRRLAENSEIIADSGEGYTRREDAERAASRVFDEPQPDESQPTDE